MFIQVLKSKIHRVTVTDARLDYIGSITIDADLLDAAGIIPGERVFIVDNNTVRASTHILLPANAVPARYASMEPPHVWCSLAIL